MDWLNYHHLLNFWLVAREGSVKRASELLHVTPASVSVQIKQLESSLGVKLLQKQGRGLTTTDMGREVAAYATEIFGTGRELMEMVKGGSGGRPRELRVGIRDAMPKLVAFRLLQPALNLSDPIRLVCVESEMPRLVADLAIHKLDVILTDTPLDPLYNVKAYSHRLGDSAVVIMGTRNLVKKYRTGFPNSLDGAPFLMQTDSSALRRQMDQWLNGLHLTPDIKGEFDDSAMMKIAARQGLGLFPTPACIHEEITDLYGLEVLGFAAGVKDRFYAISTERKLKHPSVLAIREHSQ